MLLLSPYAPHIAEELWARLGHDGSLAYAPWPAVDESLLVQSTVQLPVQVGHTFSFPVDGICRSCSLRSCACSLVAAACVHTCCKSNEMRRRIKVAAAVRMKGHEPFDVPRGLVAMPSRDASVM